jgi:SCO1/SenC
MIGIRRASNFLKVSRRFCTSGSKESGAKEAAKEVASERPAYRGPITFASLAFALVAGAGVLTYYELEKEKKVLRVASEIVTTGKPALGGPWVLVDQDGIPRTDASYKGEFALLYFGFTYCPDICPSELVKVGKIIDGLGTTLRLATNRILAAVTSRPKIALKCLNNTMCCCLELEINSVQENSKNSETHLYLCGSFS